MPKTCSQENAEAELEAPIRSAGDVVQVSPDLRPWVLEAARAGQLRQVRRRRVACAVAAVLLLAALPPRTITTQTTDGIAAGQPTEQHETVPENVRLLASSPTSWMVVSSGNDWEMVENFCRLRQYHLHVLQQAF